MPLTSPRICRSLLRLFRIAARAAPPGAFTASITSDHSQSASTAVLQLAQLIGHMCIGGTSNTPAPRQFRSESAREIASEVSCRLSSRHEYIINISTLACQAVMLLRCLLTDAEWAQDTEQVCRSILRQTEHVTMWFWEQEIPPASALSLQTPCAVAMYWGVFGVLSVFGGHTDCLRVGGRCMVFFISFSFLLFLSLSLSM